MTKLFDAVVVGAGLVGQVAALVLARIPGVTVALLDAGQSAVTESAIDDDDWDSRVYALSPSSVALLEQLGIWRMVPETRRCCVHDMHITGDAGECLDLSAYEAAVPELAWIVESRVLSAAFAESLRWTSVEQLRGICLDSLTDHDNVIHISSSCGQQFQTKLLIGADGARSWTRAAAGFSAFDQDIPRPLSWLLPHLTSYVPLAGMVANFTTTLPHHGTAFQWFRADGVLALLPLPSNRVSMVWSMSREQADAWLAEPADILLHRIQQAVGGCVGELSWLSTACVFPIVPGCVWNPVKGRVLLVGDAAHVVHPLAGQGLNLGLRDVRAVWDVLRHRSVSRDVGDAVFLRKIAQQRVLDVAQLRTITDGLRTLFSITEIPVLQWLRNRGLGLTNECALLKKHLIQQAIK